MKGNQELPMPFIYHEYSRRKIISGHYFVTGTCRDDRLFNARKALPGASSSPIGGLFKHTLWILCVSIWAESKQDGRAKELLVHFTGLSKGCVAKVPTCTFTINNVKSHLPYQLLPQKVTGFIFVVVGWLIFFF